MKLQPTTEELLPTHLLAFATRRGNEWAWPMQRIPEVIEAGRALALATLGGQIQFRCPSGTYELYWLDADATAREPGEDWYAFVQRSAYEVLTKFLKLPSTLESLQGEIEAWPALAREQHLGVDLGAYLCFVLSFAKEGEPSVTPVSPRDFREPPAE